MGNNMNNDSSKYLESNISANFSELESRLNGAKYSDIHKIRKSALENFLRLGIPNSKNEEYKYTNVDFVNSIPFKMQFNPFDDLINIDDIKKFLINEISYNRIVFINGFYSEKLSNILSNKDKLIIGSMKAHFNKEHDVFKKHFANYADVSKDSFIALNTAFAQDGAFICIPDNYIIENPIQMLYITITNDTAILSQPRNLIIIGDNSQAKIIETNYTIGDNYSFTNSLSEIILNNNSILDFYKYQNDNNNSYHISTTQIIQDSNSVFNTNTITLNGKFVRNNINVKHINQHCQTNLNGLYFLDTNSFVDNHTLISHAQPNCKSNEKYKGILDDKSKAVFNGKVIVEPNAQKTEAYQSNKNILLTNDASIKTKPQLEIFADDVKCSHGATTGNLDNEAMFYLQSRGIGVQQARALLINAFTNDIISDIKIAELRDEVKKTIAQRLNVEDIYFCKFV